LISTTVWNLYQRKLLAGEGFDQPSPSSRNLRATYGALCHRCGSKPGHFKASPSWAALRALRLPPQGRLTAEPAGEILSAKREGPPLTNHVVAAASLGTVRPLQATRFPRIPRLATPATPNSATLLCLQLEACTGEPAIKVDSVALSG